MTRKRRRWKMKSPRYPLGRWHWWGQLQLCRASHPLALRQPQRTYLSKEGPLRAEAVCLTSGWLRTCLCCPPGTRACVRGWAFELPGSLGTGAWGLEEGQLLATVPRMATVENRGVQGPLKVVWTGGFGNSVILAAKLCLSLKILPKSSIQKTDYKHNCSG